MRARIVSPCWKVGEPVTIEAILVGAGGLFSVLLPNIIKICTIYLKILIEYRFLRGRCIQVTELVYWFIFYNDKLLMCLENNTVTIPLMPDITIFNLEPLKKHYVGVLNNYQSYAVEIFSDKTIPENMKFMGLRQLFGLIDENFFGYAGRAIQIVNWDRTHQYCGQCGNQTHEKLNEYAKVCPNCGFTSYPQISPAIIVAVLKDNKILLAQSSHFKSSFYSVLSGFVEPGESLEECLKREVKEEVGIDVKNIAYVDSQPWPFPNSLMIGFIAEYANGDIIIDEEEIIDAGWFTVDNLPILPNSISIARKLIDLFIEKNSK